MGAAVALAIAGMLAGAPAAALAGSSPPQRLTRAQAKVVVKRVALTAAELPGFKAAAKHVPTHETAKEKELGKELDRCVGAGPERSLAESTSPEFKHEAGGAFETIQADVTVGYTASEAAKELDRARTPRARTCLKRYFTESFKGKQFEGGVVTSVSVADATPPALGTTTAVALRVTTILTDRGVKVPVYFDILGFTYGPTEVTLLASSVVEPFPSALEEGAYASLAKQALAST
jgi:hypothetical protein